MIEAGDILKLVVEYFYPGASEALNIFNFVFSGTDALDLEVTDALETFVTDDWGGAWADLADDNSFIESMTVQLVDSAGVVIRDVGTALIELPGNSVGGSVNPAAVAGYLQADTVLPRVMGRKYVPAIEENAIAQGLFDLNATATLLIMLGFYLADVNIISGGKLSAGVISTSKPGFQAFLPTGLIENVPAYQRRRKVGVGS